MDMELVLVPFRTDDDGNEVVTFAFRPSATAPARERQRGGQQVDVAIVGVGLHPFGRFGDRTGIDMGAIAIRRALADAGVEWRDIQFAFAGSYEIDNPDAVVALLGLTGIPFTNVYNGCATAASVARAGRRHDPARRARPRPRRRHGQAPPGRVQRRPAPVRLPVVVRRARPLPHHEVLRDEDQQVHARPRDLGEDPRPVAAKNYRNGRNPNAFRRKPQQNTYRTATTLRNIAQLPGRSEPWLARAVGVMLKLDSSAPSSSASRRSRRTLSGSGAICSSCATSTTRSRPSVRPDPTGDERTFALSRQARLIPIVATQSISSLRSALPGDESWRTLLQCFRTKLFLATSDEFTARTAADLCGRRDRLKAHYSTVRRLARAHTSRC